MVVDDTSNKLAQNERDVGFYDCVEQGERAIHVQTEVIPQENPTIQTTVFKGGAVLNMQSSRLDSFDNLGLNTEEAAARQHQSVVERALAGEF